MMIALAIEPHAISAPLLVGTARMLEVGGHSVVLLIPLQQPELTREVNHLIRQASSNTRVSVFELPPLGKDELASGAARSVIWTRFLQDQECDIVLVFHDVEHGALRCTSRLYGKVLIHVTVPSNLPRISVEGSIKGIKPHAIERSIDSSQDALFGPQTCEAILRTASRLLPATRAASDVEASYRALLTTLRKLKRPVSEMEGWARAIAFNEGPMAKRQLLLDVSVIVHGDARSGIQRVVRSLFIELLRAPPPGTDVKLIHFMGGRYRYANAFARTMKPTPHPEPEDTLVDFRQGDCYLALDLNSHLVEPAAGAFAEMQARGVSLNFVVYDILLVRHPEWWIDGTSARFENWLRSVATLADTLLCISDAVACDVRAWVASQTLPRFGQPRVSSFHLGADVANSAPSLGMPPDANTILAAIRATPSFLMVGTIEPRKGHRQALDAFELLWTQGVACNLVIVGRAGWLVEDLVERLRNHPQRNDRLFWFENASDEMLEAAYKNCACLIAASNGEGFGLPLVEAAQHGLPIIARALPVFREVAGEHVLYFEGPAAYDLASVIQRWLTMHEQRVAPDSRRIRFLAWRESATQLVQALALQPTTTQAVIR